MHIQGKHLCMFLTCMLIVLTLQLLSFLFMSTSVRASSCWLCHNLSCQILIRASSCWVCHNLNCKILIRAHPFKHMPFHGKCSEDFVTWRTSYSDINPDKFDLDNPDHEEKMGYGGIILFFTCKVRAAPRLLAATTHLVLVEEVWSYTLHPRPTT